MWHGVPTVGLYYVRPVNITHALYGATISGTTFSEAEEVRPAFVVRFAISRDGQRIAFSSSAGSPVILDVFTMSLDGNDAPVLVSNHGSTSTERQEVRDIAFSPDGSRVAATASWGVTVGTFTQFNTSAWVMPSTVPGGIELLGEPTNEERNARTVRFNRTSDCLLVEGELIHDQLEHLFATGDLSTPLQPPEPLRVFTAPNGTYRDWGLGP